MDNEDKGYNPTMQFDAFTAGIEEGGLRSTASITIISCYILAHCDEKITAKNIIESLVEGKIANYFEISDAVSKMIKTGHFTEDEDGYLHISDECRYSVSLVENDLPLTIREKSIELVRKTAKHEIYKKENRVEIEKADKQYKVTMHVSDKDADFMELSLYVPSEVQAQVIKEKFQTHPAEVYEALIDAIFSQED
ncbi:MAG: DUF4364 family protein [Clostridiales bacterium]|nr:DUF4364 family protein [Clostridiales bacterium]